MVKRLNKRIAVFLFLVVSVLGIAIVTLLQNYDVRGISLTEREAMLARAGGNLSFLFEVKEGDYELKMYHFRNGQLVKEQVFSGGGAIRENGRQPEGLQVLQNRNLITVTATRIDLEKGTWEWSLGAPFGTLGSTIEVTGIDSRAFGWGTMTNRVRLDDAEVPILYMAFTNSFPSALENIISGDFDVREASQFRTIPDLFIVTIRRIY